MVMNSYQRLWFLRYQQARSEGFRPSASALVASGVDISVSELVETLSSFSCKGSDMSNLKLEVGKWYVFEYGLSVVVGECLSVGGVRSVFSFRWGDPFRNPHLVTNSRIEAELPDPRILSRLIKKLRRLYEFLQTK